MLFEIKEEGMKIPKIGYNVYFPLYNDSLSQLNLTICENNEIDISIPVKLNDNLEKYNSSSNYYNDICSKTTSESGTDISLKDRKNEFMNKNMTLCEEDCDLVEYNYTTEKAKCSCSIKISLPLFEDIKFDKVKLYKSFTDINNFANINILKCYKNVFISKSLRDNYAFFIYINLLTFYFLSMLLFYAKYYFSLIHVIKEIHEAKIYIFKLKKITRVTTNNNNTEQDNKKLLLKSKANKKHKKSKKNIITELENNQSGEDMFPPKKKKGRNKKVKENKKLEEINTKNDNIYELSLNLSKNNNDLNDSNKNNPKILINSYENDNNDNYNKYKNILKYNDNELNSLKYKKALKYDKRTFFEYYLSLLKSGNLFIFAFYFNNNDYNSQIIKIFLFFFFFSVHFTINALFFNDSTMHKIYMDEGSFNFLYQIPQIIYSSLISNLIDIIIKYFSLSEMDIIRVKRVKKFKKLDSKFNKLYKKLKTKFALFFLISFLFLLAFGYYNICFCGIYENTQVHLIKDSVISFGLSLLYPFGIYLIPSLLRLKSLHSPKEDQKCLYKFSQFIQDFSI